MKQRIYKNPAEAQFQASMIAKGWEVMRRGAPDFFCFRHDKFICVEVKPAKHRKLTKPQTKVLTALAKRGIDCYRWTPDDGFKKVAQKEETGREPLKEGRVETDIRLKDYL